MSWTYSELTIKEPADLIDGADPWAGHKSFAYDLLVNLKPSLCVELGSFKGTSFFSFCQAQKHNRLSVELHAIDCWEGDEHSGHYNESVYQGFMRRLESNFGGQKHHIHRMFFDEALHKFEDGSIDLLHIDGLHTYEAVKHDFETWKPKLSKSAIVLFHDTEVRMKDFGVLQYWEEVRKDHPHFSFTHSNGLGVLFMDGSYYKRWEKELVKWQEHYLHLAYTYTQRDLKLALKKNLALEDEKLSILGHAKSIPKLLAKRIGL